MARRGLRRTLGALSLALVTLVALSGAPNAAGTPLVYHEKVGSSYFHVQHHPHVYLILWGSNWNSGSKSQPELGKEAKANLLTFFNDLSNSPYQEILTQYFDHTGRIGPEVTLTSYVDEREKAPASVNDSSIRNEAEEIAKSQGWPMEDPDATFMVVPGPEANYGSYAQCGWHARFSGESSLAFVVGPDKAGCIATKSAQKPVFLGSHEYAESATNPNGGTWSAEAGAGQREIADICDDEKTLSDGSVVATLWSNHLQECTAADPHPPFVYSDSGHAREVLDNSAVIEGTVNPESLPTTYYFEYGPTTALGTKVPAEAVSVGEGRTNVKVSAQLSGLEREHTYHYKLFATNSTGTVHGADTEFTPSAWETQKSHDVTASELHFAAVSCVDSANCRSVGHTEDSEGVDRVWTERWMEGEWSSQFIGGPSGSSSAEAEGVSCVASGWCVIVGIFNHNSPWSKTIADFKSEAKEVTVAYPSGVKNALLHDVSCTSKEFCVAVGSYVKGTEIARPLIDVWNGTQWSEATAPTVTEATELRGVSCSSSTTCMAVGQRESGGVVKPVAVRLQSGTWTLEKPEAPASGTIATLGDVACTSSTSCLAVGRANDEANEGFSELWSSSSWKIKQPLGGPISAVSCSSATACVAVGQKGSKVVQGELWNGTAWQALNPGGESVNRSLSGVACFANTTCIAEGQGGYIEMAPVNFWLPLTRPLPIVGEAKGLEGFEPTLEGTVNPNGHATSYRFLYGLTESYGSTAPASGEISVGSGTSPVAVANKLGALEPGKTYHYTIEAFNGETHVKSADRTFTTPPSAPLCKANETPCAQSNRYGTGTKVTAALKTGTSLTLKGAKGEVLDSCSGSSLEGQVTASGGPTQATKADVSTASFTGCSTTVTAEGLSWHSEISQPKGAGSGLATFPGLSLKAQLSGVSCTYGASTAFAMTGGAEAEMAVSEASLPKTSGSFTCPSTVSLSATYKITAPAPLYFTTYPVGATVLCKTASEVCAEANRYASATKVTASLKSATTLTLKDPSGNTVDSCSTSSLEGTVTGAGGESEVPTVDVSTATFSGCSGALSSEGLSWHSEVLWTSATNGTETFSNLALSAVIAGLTCKYGGQVAFGLTGASQAELAVSEASLAKTSGSFLCPATVKLTATYLITAPAPLYVSRPK